MNYIKQKLRNEHQQQENLTGTKDIEEIDKLYHDFC